MLDRALLGVGNIPVDGPVVAAYGLVEGLGEAPSGRAALEALPGFGCKTTAGSFSMAATSAAPAKPIARPLPCVNSAASRAKRFEGQGGSKWLRNPARFSTLVHAEVAARMV
jgi:hypothetical protein